MLVIKRFCRQMIKVRGKRPVVVKQVEKNTALEEKAKLANLDWRIVGATILHRYPVITPDIDPLEAQINEWEDQRTAFRRQQLLETLGSPAAQIIPESNPTKEEIFESMPFKPAFRVTEADIKNDRRSPERRLQDSLFLIVKRNRSEFSWQFPQGKVLDDETTLRMTTERVIDRAVGRTDRYFISNAPVGHYVYPYPSEMQLTRKQFGAKVFFYRSQLISGNVKLETRLYKDYAWIARDELNEYFDSETAEYLNNILLD